MSYLTIQAAVQVLLQALSIFEDEDVTRGDYRPLDQVGQRFCVLTPGGFTRSGAATSYGEKKSSFWTVTVDLFVRHWGTGEEYDNLAADGQTIIDEMDKYDISLDGVTGVIYAAITGGEPPRTVYDEAGSAHWLMQRLTLEVHEKVDVAGGEYPGLRTVGSSAVGGSDYIEGLK